MGSRTREILRRQRAEITIPQLIELFAATKLTEGRSKKTVEWYEEKLGRFASYLGDGGEANIKDLTLGNARSFVASLQRQDSRFKGHPYRPQEKGGLSSYTIHGYVRSLKAFSSWLAEEGFTRLPLSGELEPAKGKEPWYR